MVRGDVAQIDVCLRAAALLADGYRTTAQRWVDAVSWWLFGARVGLEAARAYGWEVRKLPIAVDFHGLPIVASDASAFTGARKTGVTLDSGDARTLYVGGKNAPVRWVLYLKSVEILARRGGDRSAYAARWSSSPHYDPDAEVTRAELRLQGEGLCFVDANTGEVFDLRDPAAVADEAVLAAVWTSAAQRRRLVIGGRTRNRRAETDPPLGRRPGRGKVRAATASTGEGAARGRLRGDTNGQADPRPAGAALVGRERRSGASAERGRRGVRRCASSGPRFAAT